MDRNTLLTNPWKVATLTAYYNENEPYAAQWLRNLIAAGHIAPGDVDERSIVDVRGDDLTGYRQCHFFAGIAGWSYALRLAGWGDDRPVWTGSCPCQPFSVAGQGHAADDRRHLWPAWFSLVRQCRPPVLLGEQVAAAIGWGWIDAVFTDLEAEGYACALAVLPACGVGAPHIRNRVWFVADAKKSECKFSGAAWTGRPGSADGGGMGVASGAGSRGNGRAVLGTQAEGQGEGCKSRDIADQPFAAGDLGNADSEGSQGWRMPEAARGGDGGGERAAGTPGHWSNVEWVECADGKARPTQPGLFPLAHGVPARVGRLRAYGNAIVPQVAAAFIAALMGEK